MDGDIIDWDARQKKLKKKVEEYDAARAQNKVEAYLFSLRLDPAIEEFEVLQAILDELIERRRLLVITGEARGAAFQLMEGQIADLQKRIHDERRD